jgi:ribosome maturation factor RimP
MAKVTEVTQALAEPIAAEQGCTVWDVEYVKEAGNWFLRVYIDKPGGVSIHDCEAVSRPLSDALDEADPIEGSYTLEVSSPGADRVLRKPEHFAAFLGSEVDLKLYRARDGKKDVTGTLTDYRTDGGVSVSEAGQVLTFEKKEIARVRVHVDF